MNDLWLSHTRLFNRRHQSAPKESPVIWSWAAMIAVGVPEDDCFEFWQIAKGLSATITPSELRREYEDWKGKQNGTT